MGSGLSRPAYPFPMPEPPPSKMSKWSFSTRRKSKSDREREKYSDVFPKYAPGAPTYGFSYYPQMPVQAAFPTYYAPVQMAVVQPIGFQQPVIPMPQTQGYVPVATYPTAAVPVQPAIARAPAVQLAPTMQMPAPAPAPPSAPVLPSAPATQMPVPPLAPASVPAPAPAMRMPAPSAPSASAATPVAPPTAPSQMPQPYPRYDPSPVQAPVIPPPPITATPVIPPPPIITSEPSRAAPDSVRPRFTDFYRPADMPSPPPRRPSVDDEPVRPLSAGPPGRTPFAPPMRMPTPMGAPNNPLPRLPADVWESSPYRQVLESLPDELPPLFDLQPCSDPHVDFPEPITRPSSRLTGIFSTTSRRDKGKGTLKGLFRSRTTSDHGVLSDQGSSSGSQHGHGRSQTVATIFVPPPRAGMSTVDVPPGAPTMSMPVPSQGPPIKFDHTGEYAGFVNHSNHRVMYKNKMYPTALHLLEAMKFTHEPALQERIRTCKDVNDMYPLSASLQEYVRPDWGQVFLQTMEEVLYLKFKQHPILRRLLLRTGLADIIYADINDYWGEGPTGEGANELGRALARVRERLRHEGET